MRLVSPTRGPLGVPVEKGVSKRFGPLPLAARGPARRLRPRQCATEPTVTVVVPCYRYGAYLEQVVDTTLAQPGVRVDVLIVDDASPDDSAAIARDLVRRDPRVSLIVHPTNRGHIATYNEGLAAASGKYVVLLSADDLLSPGCLARATSLMELHPEVGFVYGYSPDFTDTPPDPIRRDQSWSIWSGEQWIRRVCSRASNVVSTPSVVMRREIMDELGGYDSALPHSADLLIWLRAAARGSVGRVNGPYQAFYRIHGANMHLTDYGDLSSDMAGRRDAFAALFSHELEHDPRTQDLQRLVDRAMAIDALRWAIRAHDLSGDGWRETMTAYGEAATSAWPGVTSTILWRRFERRLTGRSAGALDRLWFGVDWEVRHRLRWRRWRRYGT